MEKLILSSLYLASITDRDFMEVIKEKKIQFQQEVKLKLEEMVSNQLVKEDRKTLTELGRSSIKVVLAGGVFDIIHPGHIYTLNSAKDLWKIF